MLTLWTRIRSMQRIHGDYIKTFLLGQHPSFVYQRLPYIPENEIPVYAFHNISAGTFENQIKYLAENNYRSIGADELYAVIRNGRSKQDKIVALTFDDGLKSLYDVAWPILKKYDFTGISFIAPGRILDKRNPAEDKTIADQFCSWDEIAQMHESGIFDFQSHTMHHHTVFSSSRCLGFANPMVCTSFLTTDLNPVIRSEGKDVFKMGLEPGQPIYDWMPAMVASQRYIEDEAVSRQMVSFVKNQGVGSFFRKPGWKNDIRKFYKDCILKNPPSDAIQRASERFLEIKQDLTDSKRTIEERLNKQVRYMAYPWFKGSEMAVTASREARYKGNFWGTVSGRSINRVGDNCFYIKRISADFIYMLPGKGRKSFVQALAGKHLKRGSQQAGM